MRKITEQAARAFHSAQPFKKSNTSVEVHDTDVVLKLHGHIIAWWNTITGDYEVTLAGWPTPTTRERLNGLDGVRVTQKDYIQYLNGRPWAGTWAKISDYED